MTVPIDHDNVPPSLHCHDQKSDFVEVEVPVGHEIAEWLQEKYDLIYLRLATGPV